MRRVIVCTNLSLDGVMQSPARPDEDPRNGFQRGGWAAPYAAMAHAGHVFAAADSLRVRPTDLPGFLQRLA